MSNTQTDISKATPRPWVARLGQHDHDNNGSRPIMSPETEDGGYRIAMVDSVIPRKRSTAYDAPDETRDANAALIAKAVNEYDALCAVAETAEGVMRVLETCCKDRNGSWQEVNYTRLSKVVSGLEAIRKGQ